MSEHGHDPAEHLPVTEGEEPVTEHHILEAALRELLIEKEVIAAGELTRLIEALETRTPALGAKIVARMWTDPEYRELALKDGKAAAEQELGIDLVQAPELIVLENQPRLHHVVVCTLCSCYPTQVLGASPTWYRSKAYRARVVQEPRAVLSEFGTELPDDKEIRVVDSTPEDRYLVVPMRPPGSEGMSREELAALINRDSLIGVTQATAP